MVALRSVPVVADGSTTTTRSSRKRAAHRESISPVRKNQARHRSVAPAAAAAAASVMPLRPQRQAAPRAISAAAPKAAAAPKRGRKERKGATAVVSPVKAASRSIAPNAATAPKRGRPQRSAQAAPRAVSAAAPKTAAAPKRGRKVATAPRASPSIVAAAPKRGRPQRSAQAAPRAVSAAAPKTTAAPKRGRKAAIAPRPIPSIAAAAPKRGRKGAAARSAPQELKPTSRSIAPKAAGGPKRGPKAAVARSASPQELRRSERIGKMTDAQKPLPVRTQLRAMHRQSGAVQTRTDLTKLYLRPDTKMNEVFEQALRETVEMWTKRESNEEIFDVDYIVAKQAPIKGEVFPTGTGKVLLKWSGFPVPTWENLDDGMNALIAEYSQKLSFEDNLELKLRKRMGNKTFNETFPNRFLVPENADSNFGYVKEELALERNRLSAIAHDWTVLSGVQIYIIDWTSMPSASGNLKELTFILETQRTPTVRKIMASGLQKSLTHIKCTAACSQCEYTEDVGAPHSCCAMPSTIERDSEGNVQFVKEGVEESSKSPFYFECTDHCECDKLRCKNRSVQNGRTKPLAVVRLPQKDWALFAVEPIRMDDFITEYVGQMIPGHSRSAKDRCYDFTLLYDAVRKSGPNSPFRINSAKMGNEGRFAAHSCEPTMYVAQVIVERDGECINRVAFYAQANIDIGDELTFDYFPDETLEDCYDKVINFFGIKGCACHSKMCRFSEKLIKKYNRNNNNNNK